MKTLILLTILIGCSKHYDQEACEELSMKKFRGFPNASRQFDDNCKNFKIKYNQRVCQNAYNKLISTGDIKRLQSRYGEKIIGCFTKKDLKIYSRK